MGEVKVGSVSNLAVDFDPRGRYLAVGSNDATVTLWESEEWTCVESFGHFEYVPLSFPFRSFPFFAAVTFLCYDLIRRGTEKV